MTPKVASGASSRKGVEVRVLSWAPHLWFLPCDGAVGLGREQFVNAFSQALRVERRPHLYVIVEIDENIAAGKFRTAPLNNALGVGGFRAARPVAHANGPLVHVIIRVTFGVQNFRP